MPQDASLVHPNLDHDINLDNPDIICDYYDQDRFFNNFTLNTNSKFLHINARSLVNSISDIQHYVSLLGNDFSIIGISETWLHNIDDPLIKLDGYSIEGVCRHHKRGGVALYINENYIYRTRNDLCLNTVDFESCFIEIESAVSGNIIVGILYKPPDTSCVNFIDGFNKILGHVQNENKKCYIMGDFNINLLHHITNGHVQDFIDMISSNSFVPLTNKPTCII